MFLIYCPSIEGVKTDASATARPLHHTSVSCDLVAFDFVISKIDNFIPCSMDHVCQFAAQSFSFVFTSLVADERLGRKHHTSGQSTLVEA